MATHYLPILNWRAKPDTSGSVFPVNLDSVGTNKVWDHLVMAFADTASRIGLAGAFSVPNNYVGSASIVVVWTTTAISGNVRWEFDYRAVGGDDLESLDQVGTQEAVVVTDAAPSASLERMTAEMALTSGNLAALDTVQFELFRDGAEAGPIDTIAATVYAVEVFFKYNDA